MKMWITLSGVCVGVGLVCLGDEAKQEGKAILERVEKTRLEQQSDWNLERVPDHQSGPFTSTHRWRRETNHADVSLSVLASAPDANDFWKRMKEQITSGPVHAIEQLGDEAFMTQSHARSNCMIVFRQTNVVVQINASSWPIGEKWALMVEKEIEKQVGETNSLNAALTPEESKALSDFRADKQALIRHKLMETVRPLLRNGMSKQEVEALIGPPDHQSSNQKLWGYTLFYSSTLALHFDSEGKVERISGIWPEKSTSVSQKTSAAAREKLFEVCTITLSNVFNELRQFGETWPLLRGVESATLVNGKPYDATLQKSLPVFHRLEYRKNVRIVPMSPDAQGLVSSGEKHIVDEAGVELEVYIVDRPVKVSGTAFPLPRGEGKNQMRLILHMETNPVDVPLRNAITEMIQKHVNQLSKSIQDIKRDDPPGRP